jgi:cell division protease FtsH
VWLSSPDRPVSDLPPVRTPKELRDGNGSATGVPDEVPQDEAAGARPEHPAGPVGEVPPSGSVDPGRLG